MTVLASHTYSASSSWASPNTEGKMRARAGYRIHNPAKAAGAPQHAVVAKDEDSFRHGTFMSCLHVSRLSRPLACALDKNVSKNDVPSDTISRTITFTSGPFDIKRLCFCCNFLEDITALRFTNCLLCFMIARCMLSSL